MAVGLRIGAPLVQPHSCQHCGALVDCFATHGLSCRWSQGRFSRHASLNAVIKRSLESARIPSRLEPNGISRNDGRRPDGASLIPWECGRVLVWDVTCPDSFSPSRVALAASGAGNVANEAEHHKRVKYSDLGSSYLFVPIAIETAGVFGSAAAAFLRELGRRVKAQSGDERSAFFLLQRISIELQRGNAASMLGSLP